MLCYGPYIAIGLPTDNALGVIHTKTSIFSLSQEYHRCSLSFGKFNLQALVIAEI